MRPHIITLLLFNFCKAYSQELDIFQNDSIYSRNKICTRTMFVVNEDSLQKELVTSYDRLGRKLKQSWFFNGDLKAHNIQTFHYLSNGSLYSIIDSIEDNEIETTTLVYDKDILVYQVTINENKDTTDFRTFPGKNITEHRWYTNGKAYRFDTTVFERENVKTDYRGIDNSDGLNWHYKFHNVFDSNGNLSKVESKQNALMISSREYFYDNRNLLIKKQEVFYFTPKTKMEMKYVFVYKKF